MMLHTKYQGTRPCGFRQEDFFHIFPIKAYVKRDPVAKPFFYNLNKPGRDPLGDATYQISRLQAFSFKTRRFLVFISKIYF